ncbi:Protein of unknown function [Bacillus cytotoxicus]|uniref:Uncharacterized protein n=1 Tax=Bacillus cytotoxicus TaxID=580165 RepID=A0AAX2CH17_9BACI|nr:Protein of unknown function [Bacillus cytotoxicus]SCN36635.1 Protein of unknown function [Bacillus cytotoxicus]
MDSKKAPNGYMETIKIIKGKEKETPIFEYRQTDSIRKEA